MAAYARYSTGMQTENSIAYQMSAIKNTALEQTPTAKDHAFDAVIIYDITRGSRDIADWFAFRKAMMMVGIEVMFIRN